MVFAVLWGSTGEQGGCDRSESDGDRQRPAAHAGMERPVPNDRGGPHGPLHHPDRSQQQRRAGDGRKGKACLHFREFSTDGRSGRTPKGGGEM